MLMTMKKVNIKPENANAGREMIAFIEYLRIEYPAVYRTFCRYRQSIESAFSAQKPVRRYIRRRVRKRERQRIENLQALIARNVSLSAPPGEKKPQNWDETRGYVFGMMAEEIAGRAQVNEAHAMAIAANLREIIKWERHTGEKVNFVARTAFTPIP